MLYRPLEVKALDSQELGTLTNLGNRAEGKRARAREVHTEMDKRTEKVLMGIS